MHIASLIQWQCTPALSPEERENRLLPLEHPWTPDLPARRERNPLAPGERERVRASVNVRAALFTASPTSSPLSASHWNISPCSRLSPTPYRNGSTNGYRPKMQRSLNPQLSTINHLVHVPLRLNNCHGSA